MLLNHKGGNQVLFHIFTICFAIVYHIDVKICECIPPIFNNYLSERILLSEPCVNDSDDRADFKFEAFYKRTDYS